MTNVRIAFLGQCFLFGYRGVAPHEVYPQVVKRRLERERPGLRVDLVARGVYHPAELKHQVQRTLGRERPDLLVIDAAANTLVNECEAVNLEDFPAWVGALAERIRHARVVARGLAQPHPITRVLVERFEQFGRAAVDGPLRRLVHRRPRPTLAEYASLLDEAVTLVKQREGPALLLQGPSAFNPDESHRVYASNALRVYRDASDVVGRVATSHDVAMVNRLKVFDGCSRDIFLDGSLRLSPSGHERLGHAVAETLLRSGMVQGRAGRRGVLRSGL